MGIEKLGWMLRVLESRWHTFAPVTRKKIAHDLCSALHKCPTGAEPRLRCTGIQHRPTF